jgi:hypothetical protein
MGKPGTRRFRYLRIGKTRRQARRVRRLNEYLRKEFEQQNLWFKIKFYFRLLILEMKRRMGNPARHENGERRKHGGIFMVDDGDVDRDLLTRDDKKYYFCECGAFFNSRKELDEHIFEEECD